MSICTQKCQSSICEKVGCLNQSALKFKELIEFGLLYKEEKGLFNSANITDANVFGEFLRNYAFLKETGCYSCFDLKDEFKKIDKKSLQANEILIMLGHDEEDDFIYNASHIYSNGKIIIAWVWDGDGHLIVSDGNKRAENTDCKKDYTWKWI